MGAFEKDLCKTKFPVYSTDWMMGMSVSYVSSKDERLLFRLCSDLSFH